MNLTEATTKTTLKLQDKADTLSVNDIQDIIINTLEPFSKDLPRKIVGDIDGDGSFDYTPPTGFLDGFSVIDSIEYPAGERIPVKMLFEDWTIYDDGVNKKIRFLVATPATGETARVTYTIPYAKATIVNIPSNHIDAFINLVAFHCLMAIAVRFGFSQTPTIAADSVDYQSKGGIFAKRAREFKKTYEEFVGKSGGVKPASLTFDWDRSPTWGGDHMTHSQRYR